MTEDKEAMDVFLLHLTLNKHIVENILVLPFIRRENF